MSKEKGVKPSKLEAVMAKLNKSNGAGSVMYLSEDNVVDYERISTGSIGLDASIGGGFPLGRIIELFGAEGSGKTTVCLMTMANAQKEGRVCAFIDMEQAYDARYAEALGVDNSKVIFLQPSNGEEALQSARELIETGEIDLLFVDSIATLVPKAEIEAEIGDNQMGLHARMMSKGCRALSPVANEHNVLIVFTNQIREKIGVMFGNPETTTGGNAMKFYASIRIQFYNQNSKTQQDSDGVKTAKKVRAKCIKNKTFPPHRECEYFIEFGTGVDNITEIVEMGVEKGIIDKSGSWYSYEETKLGQGVNGVKVLLADNPELQEELTAKILENG